MKELLADKRYDVVSREDKDFIIAVDEALQKRGYAHDGIKPYVVFGKYVTAYRKAGLKTKKYVCRFYFRDDSIVFRIYLSNIDKHRDYIEAAPDCIQNAFTSDVGDCGHCDNHCKGKDGVCRHQKRYTLHGKVYEKCGGNAFYFDDHGLCNVETYMKLLTTFYPVKKKTK